MSVKVSHQLEKLGCHGEHVVGIHSITVLCGRHLSVSIEDVQHSASAAAFGLTRIREVTPYPCEQEAMRWHRYEGHIYQLSYFI